jgi:photosystem II stability/assembly factor-like uncharacterized protein
MIMTELLSLPFGSDASGGRPFLRKVFFGDAYHGYALGTTNTAAVVVKTDDGGVTWDSVYQTKLPLYGIYFRSAAEGWIVGGTGTILSTSDGGVTWNVRKSGTEEDLYAVTGDASGTIFVVGKQTTVLKSTDGGANWVKCSPPTTGDLVDVLSLPSGALLVLGSNQLLKSVDSGASWVKHGPYEWTHLYALAFVDDEAGFLTAGPVLRTTDGGNTLTLLSVPIDGPGARVYVAGPKILYLLANTVEEGGVVVIPGQKLPSHSTILKSKDMGSKWEPVFQIDDKKTHRASLLDLFFIGEHGWAVGEEGTVVFTKDGGKTWEESRVVVR